MKKTGSKKSRDTVPLSSEPLTFSFAQLAKGKSLGRSKPATNSQIQALATHCVDYFYYIKASTSLNQFRTNPALPDFSLFGRQVFPRYAHLCMMSDMKIKLFIEKQ